MTDLDPLDLRRIPRDLPSSAYKLGDEFKPFHPSASHVPPDYRDGWNRCWLAAKASEVEAARASLPAPAKISEIAVTAALQVAHLKDTPESRKDMRRALESVFVSSLPAPPENWRQLLGEPADKPTPSAEWQRLYAAVNELMAHMGAHGSADARGDRAQAVMDALHAIDGGTVKESLTLRPDDWLPKIAEQITRMLASSTEHLDGLGYVAGYTIKTGALHRIIGLMAEADCPVVIPSPAQKSQDAIKTDPYPRPPPDELLRQCLEAMEAYANASNWDADDLGTRRVWLEPGGYPNTAYDGFEKARAAISALKALDKPCSPN